AAGALLVVEAGGTVSAIDGGAFDPFRPSILATNGRLQDAMLSLLRPR
ncbi:MAG TPA: inositol monophosphatase, partial [Rhodospirillales bacterium]|nr:inositol monophosphatase [Rhodospirillales bacterium]